MTAPTRFRFLRVLEYVGTAERLTEARERRAVKGTQHFGKDLSIYEGLVGDAAQPVVGQMRLKLCEMIVKLEEEMRTNPAVFPADYCEGYEAACQELFALIEFKPDLEKDNA